MELRLRATSVSAALLNYAGARRQWTVLGVHDGSLNLLVGGEVCSVVRPDVGNLPRGILAELPSGESWKGLGLTPGENVFAEPTLLRVRGEFCLDLATAAVWQPRRSLPSMALAADIVHPSVQAAVEVLVGSRGLGALASRFDDVAAGTPLTGLEDPFLDAAAPMAREVILGLRMRDLPAFRRGARGLVGLGIGLTPSGDDLLTGLLGSLVLMAEQLPALGWFVPEAESVAEYARARTTPVGSTYLRCAAHGEITERHEALLNAVLSGSMEASRDACHALRSFGHSSGGEIALGTLLAVHEALDEPL